MAREWLDEDDQDWKPLLGERPSRRLARYPGGDFVAMQVSAGIETTAERAGTWDTRTRKIAWNLERIGFKYEVRVQATIRNRTGKIRRVSVTDDDGPRHDHRPVVFCPVSLRSHVGHTLEVSGRSVQGGTGRRDRGDRVIDKALGGATTGGPGNMPAVTSAANRLRRVVRPQTTLVTHGALPCCPRGSCWKTTLSGVSCCVRPSPSR